MRILDTLDLKGIQRTAAETRGRDISLAAGAGSGKTRTLVARYLSLLDENHPPRSVAAITFTDRAAREMRNRVRSSVHAWLASNCPAEERAHWQEIEADMDAARISTIHGLGTAILRAHPAEAGVDPRFEVLEEGLAAALKQQAVDDALAWAVDQEDLTSLFQVFETRDLKQIASSLLERPLEASAIPDRAGLESLWNRAVGEALTRFASLPQIEGVIGDLRALAAAGGLARDAGATLTPQVEGLLAQWREFEQALDRQDILGAARALYTVRRSHCDGRSGGKSSRAKAAVSELRQVYDAQVQGWLGGKAAKDPPPDPQVESRALDAVACLARLLQRALQEYSKAKETRQALDFDDLEQGALQLLRVPSIRARWQRQIDAVLVDEFQDTNERQRELVEALAGLQEGCTGRLFIVGDAKQSIYGFRGADVTVFRRLDKDIRARGGLPLTLDGTFRAHSALVHSLNEILATVMGSDEDASQPFRIPFAALTPERDSPRAGIREPYVEFLYGLGDSADESAGVAARLLARRLHELHNEEQVRWEDIALLFRASTGFPNYETALQAANIPFVTVAGRGFYDRPEIRDLLNILRAVADPWDDLAMAGLLRSPAFGLTDAALYSLRWQADPDPRAFWDALAGDLSCLAESDRRQAERARGLIAQFSGLVDRVPVAELLKRVLDQTHYPALLAADESGARLQRNVDKLLADAHQSALVRVTEFLEYIETLQAAGAREGEAPTEAGGSVRLMTIHKAKGLEFPVVVIADASRGRPPLRSPVLLSPQFGLVASTNRLEQATLAFGLAKAAERARGEAEDLRLLYVAATRTREKLIICGHKRERSADLWMTQLANAALLNVDLLEAEPGVWKNATLPACGQVVRGMAYAEPTEMEAASPSTSQPLVAKHPHFADSVTEPRFYKPITALPAEETDAKREAGTTGQSHARRVIGRYLRPDGTVLGTLVHAAIRRWCFPGDPRLESLLRTVALEEGLVQPEQAETTRREATELLARFRQDARWREMDAAERRHEVPYSLSTEMGPATGYVDLMYRCPQGHWQIVEFKTEAVGSDLEVEIMVRGKQGLQVRRYHEVVHRLLREPVEAALCLLNYAGAVRWVPIVNPEPHAHDETQ